MRLPRIQHPACSNKCNNLAMLILRIATIVASVAALATPPPSNINGKIMDGRLEQPTTGKISNQQLNIAFVTGNKMKVGEVEMILAESGTTNLTHPESSLVNLRVIQVDLPEIQEVNTHGIAKEKALLGAQLAGGPCLVEDTSLKFHALGGMPLLAPHADPVLFTGKVEGTIVEPQEGNGFGWDSIFVPTGETKPFSML
eukprot:CAMPEP_0170208670 /NCGR_PEP_ID=MMETSP0116_2-20130129/3921_1 /TAXON_ID=400756 /ORGANISM="Durinskia baltica, Strain CSIRO CS-38" /LENGTH=198 /DNA_ID=CAMNT_0010459145 /DNA_START=96 /DNA_END=689 /DNA_ORIENTATION=+